jgi:phage terminase small subunit
MPLTPKQQTFVAEYLKDLNATRAAVRAGYSAKTAQEQSSRLLSNVMVAEAVQKAMDKRSERTQIDADYVLSGIRDVVEATRQSQPMAALKGFELLGKHLELFTDKQKVSGDKDAPIRVIVDI